MKPKTPAQTKIQTLNLHAIEIQIQTSMQGKSKICTQGLRRNQGLAFGHDIGRSLEHRGIGAVNGLQRISAWRIRGSELNFWRLGPRFLYRTQGLRRWPAPNSVVGGRSIRRLGFHRKPIKHWKPKM